jgi:alkane 1-monooxygenase
MKLPFSKSAGSPKPASDTEAANDAVLDRVATALTDEPTADMPEADAPPPLAEPDSDEKSPETPPLPATKAKMTDGLQNRALSLWQEWAALRPFAIATLAPVPFLLLGAFFGGFWALLSLLILMALGSLLDNFLALPEPGHLEGDDLKRADQLCIALAGTHFVLLLIAVFALSGGSGLGFFSWIAVFLSFGMWFGQVSNSNGHELIHRTDKRLFRLGMSVFISMLFGHHTSAHRLIHHRYVATTEDPNTAAAGESFYAFAPRAWWEAFLAGYEMESEMRKDRDTERLFDLHPYAVYIGGAMLGMIIMTTAFGGFGLLAYLALCAYAQLQLHLSDYVQHYGILRQKTENGELEPVGPQHSWNARHPVSALMMLNAPRHSDHHRHPSRPFPELKKPEKGNMPTLPYSLPMMGAIALVPQLWFRIMDSRLAALRPDLDRWSKPIV